MLFNIKYIAFMSFIKIYKIIYLAKNIAHENILGLGSL